MYFLVCKNCGANLEPGEKCDCMDRMQKVIRIFDKVLSEEPDGQIRIGGLFDEQKKELCHS